MKGVQRSLEVRAAQASAREVGPTDLADGTRGGVDVGRRGAGRVKLRGVGDSVEVEEASAPVASSGRSVYLAGVDSTSDEGEAVSATVSARRVKKIPGVDSDSDEGVTQGQGPIKRVRFGNVDLSDDEFGPAFARRRGARLRGRGRGCERSAVTQAMSDEFGKLVDPLTCRAKIWIDRRSVAHPEWLGVLRQCGKVCDTDSRSYGGIGICQTHRKNPAPHGKIGEVMSRDLYDKCVKERDRRATMSKAERRGKYWYTRCLMWKKANEVRLPTVEERGRLEYLEELTFEERKEALRRTHESFRTNEGYRMESGGKGAKVLVEQGCGPQTANEVDDEEFSCYNGKDGGRDVIWYEPKYFQRILRRMGVSVATITERECVKALRDTSDGLAAYSEVYKASLVPYAGPQCYPQLKDRVRLEANSHLVGKKKNKRNKVSGGRQQG